MTNKLEKEQWSRNSKSPRNIAWRILKVSLGLLIWGASITSSHAQISPTSSVSPTHIDPSAQSLIDPRSARPHNAGGKFSWGFTSLVAADASVRALDIYSTHLMLTRGYHEMILPKAIADSTPRMAAYSGLCVVENALVAHWLVKHKRRRMADMYMAGDVAQDGFWAVRNLTLKGKR